MKPTQEQVIAWAREAGITFQTHQGISGRLRTLTEGSQSVQRIKTIAALAYDAGRADENEACAKVCEAGTGEPVQMKTLEILRQERERIATAIRARREQ